MTVSADGVDVVYTEGGGRTELRPNSIICSNSDGEMTTFNAEGINFGQTQSIITGISDSKGTSSRIAVSQKCLADNYLPLSGGTLTGALTATKFTGDGSGLTNIPAEQLTGTIAEARLPDLSGKYLPISGGTITGDTTIMGSGGQYGLRIINGDIHFLSDGGSSVLGVLGGITGSKGTSTIYAMSQKGVADNYIAKTDISNAKGTDTTKVPSLKCLSDNYLPLSGGTLTGELNADKGLQAIGAKIYGGASITGATDIYDLTAHDFRTKSDDETESISIDQTSIRYYNTNDNTGWTFAGTVFSTTDLTAGTSALPDNQLYFVYE